MFAFGRSVAKELLAILLNPAPDPLNYPLVEIFPEATTVAEFKEVPAVIDVPATIVVPAIIALFAWISPEL